MNQKARDFFAWLNACPFKVWKIQYDGHGKTTVSFIWDTSTGWVWSEEENEINEVAREKGLHADDDRDEIINIINNEDDKKIFD